MRPLPELLAPAGEWQAFIAAVESGANAVYLGGKAFSARQSAANFDLHQISEAVRYAHLRGVRVYVTVNTLLLDSEVPEALDFCRTVFDLGVDACIVQDLGLMAELHQRLPAMRVHASTQATAHSTPGGVALQSIGVRRVVLARELSIADIGALDRSCDVELETFVHGALCVSYSGQCLMSSMIGGRSGNRGRCAQPCRLEYDLVTLGAAGATLAEVGVSGHLLSPKDLNGSALLGDLWKAGVDSLKIEGRMKRPEYVATVTRVYSGLIRQLADGDPAAAPPDADDLLGVFNRGASTGYLAGNPGAALMSHSRANNRGRYLGRVVAYDPRGQLASIALEAGLSVGDALEVWVSQGGRAVAVVRSLVLEPAGLTVPAADMGDTVTLKVAGKIRRGDRVFKTRDADLLGRAQESFREGKSTRRTALAFRVSGRLGVPMTIEASAPDGTTACAETVHSLELAVRVPLSADFVRGQLSRLGGTAFELERLDFALVGSLMLPVSDINGARRAIVKELEGARLAHALSTEARLPPQSVPVPKAPSAAVATGASGSVGGVVVVVDSAEGALAAVESGAAVIAVDLSSRRFAELVDARGELSSAAKAQGCQLALALPRVIKDTELEQVWRDVEAYLQADASCELISGGLGAIRAFGPRLPGLRWTLDHSLGLMNASAARIVADIVSSLGGLPAYTCPSLELTLRQIALLAPQVPMPLEAVVHGAATLMVSEHCFVSSATGADCAGPGRNGTCESASYAIRDRVGAVFPLGTDRFCRGYVRNSRDLCAIEHIGDLVAAGVERFRVDAGSRPNAWIREVTSVYARELHLAMSGGSSARGRADARATLEGLSPYGLTKGHLFRGVTDAE